MRSVALVVLLGLVACGGGEEKKPEEPKPEEPKVEETKPEEPKPAGPDFAAMSEADQKAWLMKRGEEVYTSGAEGGTACVTCHQADGKGMAGTFPPLVGQKDIMGDCAKHAGLVVHGVSGEITVDGQKYNNVMPPMGGLKDEDVAAVITYERASFGNDFGHCMPADVAAARNAPAPKLQ